MKTFNKGAWFAGASLMCGLAATATPAIAQDQSEPVATTEQPVEEAVGPNTGPTPGVDGGVSDIIITATRREQALQRVPLAVTALTGDTLELSNVVDLQNVPLLAPGVQIQPQFVPGNAVFQIRGQSQSDTGPTIQASVALYFDDVYIARSTGSLVNLVDISRVEVLRGPQGTLFGRNNTGGAIRLVSNRPTNEFEGYVSGRYESYNHYTLEGVVNVPIVDGAALRLVGQFDETDGYGTNLVTGNDYDWQRTAFVRGSLQLEPTDNLTIVLQGDYTDTRGGGLVSYLGYYEPRSGGGGTAALGTAVELGLWDFNPANIGSAIQAGAAVLSSLVTPNGTRNTRVDLRPPTADSYTFNPATRQFTFVGGSIDPENQAEIWGLTANINLDLGFASLRSITAYRKTDYFASYDLDGTQLHLLDSWQSNDSEQFSQEIILSGTTFNDRFDWTLGGLYFEEDALQTDRAVAFAALVALQGNAGSLSLQRGKSTSYGLFGQGTFRLTDALSLTAGVRWSRDDQTFIADSFQNRTGGLAPLCVFTEANGLATLPIFTAPCTLTQEASDDEWSYTASLNYQLDRDRLIYVRTSRGYRAGGFNPRILAPESLGSFDPEVVTDYEIGLKADWLDRTLRTNIAVFTSKGTDIQASRSGLSSQGIPLTFLENRGTRRVTGVEIEAIARPTDWFTYNAGLTYLDARLDDPLNPDVDYVTLTPEWSWNMGATITMPLSPDLMGTLRGDISFRDEMVSAQDPIRDRTTGQIITKGFYDDVTLLSARFSVVHQPTGIEFAVYARNLTNQYYQARTAFINSLGFAFSNLAEPRVFGAEVTVPFGAAAGR